MFCGEPCGGSERCFGQGAASCIACWCLYCLLKLKTCEQCLWFWFSCLVFFHIIRFKAQCLSHALIVSAYANISSIILIIVSCKSWQCLSFICVIIVDVSSLFFMMFCTSFVCVVFAIRFAFYYCFVSLGVLLLSCVFSSWGVAEWSQRVSHRGSHGVPYVRCCVCFVDCFVSCLFCTYVA